MEHNQAQGHDNYTNNQTEPRYFKQIATLAQLVEHLTCNEDVVGSIPTGGSILP